MVSSRSEETGRTRYLGRWNGETAQGRRATPVKELVAIFASAVLSLGHWLST